MRIRNWWSQIFRSKLQQQKRIQALQQSQQLWWEIQKNQAQEKNPDIGWSLGDLIIQVDKAPEKFSLETYWHSAPEFLKKKFRIYPPNTELHFFPILADRSLFITLPDPLWVLPHQKISAIILTPAWVRIQNSQGNLFTDCSSQPFRMSWSGINTLAGDLCYSTTAVDLLYQHPLAYESWQVATPIMLSNEYNTALLVETLLVPHPFLSLCLDFSGKLSTPPVHYFYYADEVALDWSHTASSLPKEIHNLGPRSNSAYQLRLRIPASMRPD